ncbi:MAG: PmoA family protein [Pirellula sp.]
MSRNIPRCRIEPTAESQFVFTIHGREVTRWHFSPLAPGPFFYPVRGPSGKSLTRMGHPGAPNHDHHRSLWFAHEKLLGVDFWSIGKPPRIVQKQWYAIDDKHDFARIGFVLHWLDGHDPQPLITHDLIATIRPHSDDPSSGWSLELQSDFSSRSEGVEFRQSNFGILGLRLAKSISAHFGGGIISGQNGKVGEAELFGVANRWMDYSGPSHLDSNGVEAVEGITLIDHRGNPNSPCKWHVRSDGWMGPSLSRDSEVAIPNGKPLTVRYLLDIHPGLYDSQRALSMADRFDTTTRVSIEKSTQPHRQYEFSNT